MSYMYFSECYLECDLRQGIEKLRHSVSNATVVAIINLGSFKNLASHLMRSLF